MTARPETVLVGNSVYSIAWLSEDEWMAARESPDDGGTADHIRNTIRIRSTPGGSEATYQETLLHEIQHAVWATAGLQWTHRLFGRDDREEAIITLTTERLLLVIRDNPQVIKYLQSDGTVVR